MSSGFNLNVQSRTELGKGANRRLRRLQGSVPGTVYGGEKPPNSVVFAENHIVKLAESEAFFTSLVTLTSGKRNETVVVKDVQRHPATNDIIHVDFMRVSTKTKITMHVPLHFINADLCPGVKLQGGIPAYAINDMEISCLPGDLPEYIEVDMANLNLGDSLHLSDLVLPQGVESIALSHGDDYNLQVASINTPRGGMADEAEEETAAEEETQENQPENSKANP